MFKNFWPWNIRHLINALKEKSEVNELMYAFFAFVLHCLLPMTESIPRSQQYVLIIESTIGFLGIALIYGKRSEFLKSAICLSVPVAFRLILLAIGVAVIIGVLRLNSDQKEVYMLYSRHIFNISGFILLGYYLTKVKDFQNRVGT